MKVQLQIYILKKEKHIKLEKNKRVMGPRRGNYTHSITKTNELTTGIYIYYIKIDSL